MYRQGDILLIPIDEVPDTRGAAQARDVRGRIVLAEGEATGHAHAIEANGARLFGDDLQRRFLEVIADGGVDLVHEEHAAIHLNPGAYRVVRQREWVYESTPVSTGRTRWVAD